MTTASNQSESQPLLSGRQIARTIFLLLVFCALIFGSAGTLAWWEGWAFLVVGVLGWNILSRLHIARVHPDLIRERASYDEKSDVKPWDRWLMPLIAIVGPLATLIVAGLDKRFGWSVGPALWVQLAALVIFALCTLFGHWANLSNRFFASVVRIQTDRGHQVVDSGPYRIVRHPAYAASTLAYLAIPLLMGSWWSYIPAGLTVAGYVLRTALEDRTLRNELPGYEDFTHETRFRLIPGIW